MSAEELMQINIINWARSVQDDYPALKWLMHIPNGGKRNISEAAKFKKMGVKAGVADLLLPVPKGVYNGLWIELKYGKNTLQDSQQEFLADMENNGYFVCTCYSKEAAVILILEYLNLSDIEPYISIKNNSVIK